MSELSIAVLGRNEAGRFLPSALRAWSSFADRIIFLDDQSTDNTAQLAKDAGCMVFSTGGCAPMWGAESPARQQLFDLACEFTPDDGYILFLDCDMVPAQDPTPLMDGTVSAWAFNLYDLWGEKDERPLYRWDAFWQGHLHPRVWMIRNPGRGDYVWSGRGIHTGHLPENVHFTRGVGFAPQDMSLLHYAFSDYGLRKEKYAQYMSQAGQLTAHEAAHARSITDPNPSLYPLPFTPVLTLEREYPDHKEAA